ncbi:MAG: DUF4440 domain-containing protein [Candidatus Sulfotelmatobacter sp.]
MTNHVWLCTVTVVTLSAASCTGGGRTITQDELVRRTQEIVDAVASGDRRPFEKYFAADSMIFDEKGRSMDKKAFVADQSPLPAGYSGSIKVVNPQSRILGDTAILSYDLDETETIFSQVERARYHETDTWMRRNGDWQIVAEQVLRYYEDPAAGKPDLKRYVDYVGTYELAPGNVLTVSIEGADLFSQRPGKVKNLLVPEAPDIFFVKGVEGRRLFRRNEKGRVEALIDRRNNEDVVWKKTG